MTPIYLNSSSNDQYSEHQFFSSSDQHIEHQFLSPNSQVSSSSHSLTCHLFFNPETHDQDGDFNRESHPSQQEGDNYFGSQAYDDQCVDNQVDTVKSNDGLKFSLWKRETYDHMNDENQVKWMSSKMRVMLKMKKSDPRKLNSFRSTDTEVKLEDHQNHKEPISSPMEENANESNSINSTSSNNNITSPVRVCSDCNTTKTPLWRSGPQGPKSLCNACGIRQRKARKAMAMAAAAETGKIVFNDKPSSLKATKVLHKDHRKPNGLVTKCKKRQHLNQITTNPSYSSSSPTQKNCVEEFLVRLRKNVAFHRVFPQDEKEAAILLMALSYGYVHE